MRCNKSKKTILAISLALSLLIVVTERYRFYRVRGESMYPTIEPYSFILVDRKAELSVSDIVVFELDNIIYVKRIVGCGGDTVSMIDGDLYVNGQLMHKNSSPESWNEEWKVPEGSLLLLGDNPSESIDSRFWCDPFVKETNVIGVVCLE